MSSIFAFNRSAFSEGKKRRRSRSAAVEKPKSSCVLCGCYIFKHQESDRLPLGFTIRGGVHLPCRSKFLDDPEAYFADSRSWRKEVYEQQLNR